ncbi:MAG: hypothetical protein ACOYMQ_15040 [Pseudanabaena sp.]
MSTVTIRRIEWVKPEHLHTAISDKGCIQAIAISYLYQFLW